MTAPARLARWIWAGPLAFALHDSEEIATLAPWAGEHRSELPALAQSLADLTTEQFALAVVCLLAGYLAAAWHGMRAVHSGRRPLPFLIVSGMFVGNGVTHVMQALYFREYVPGVVTAVLISLPYGLILMTILSQSRITSRATFALLVLLGIGLQLPVTLLALAAATRM